MGLDVTAHARITKIEGVKYLEGEVYNQSLEVVDYETGQFVITQGLNSGDLVVTVGTKFLRAGEKVAYEKGQAQ